MLFINCFTLSRTPLAALIAFVAVALTAVPLYGQDHAGHKPDTVAPPAKRPAAAPKKPAQKATAKKTTTRKAATKPATPPKKNRAKPARTKAPAKSVTTPSRDSAGMKAMPSMTDSAHRAHTATDPAHRVQTPDATHAPMNPSGSSGGGQMQQGHSGQGMKMMMTSPLGISMERMGSGTTWIPDAVTLPSRHVTIGKWDLLFHGFVFLQYDKQDGPRGDDQFGSLNWGMAMASHALAGGLFQVRTMLSLDPWTVTERGYPLLLQSGEAYRGLPLHDRQHPHDFWMELGALYERPISRNLGLSFYTAPAGEPALGPVAFMHRPSAMDNLAAPLAHHWMDATHISFGVLTAGLFSRTWKIEGSAFNGREPDEERWNFDPIRIDSYSGRVTFNPDSAWSFTGGFGYLKSPEALNPDESMHRILFSALHGARIGTEGQWASALMYGGNKHGGEDNLSHAILLESEAVLNKSNTLFGRAELVQKSADDLALDQGPVFPVPPPVFAPDRHFNVGHASLGYIRELWRGRGTTIGLGASGTVNLVPSPLEGYYGSRTPVGGFLFLRLRPYYQKMGTMNMSH
jgi:hypothetical protein